MTTTTEALQRDVSSEGSVQPTSSSTAILPDLMPVMQGLSTWGAAVGIDWEKWDGPVIQLPKDMLLDDLAKVAAYSSGVKEIRMLCDLVLFDKPHIAFPVLLALSELVTRAHKKQLDTIMENISSKSLSKYADKGHCQCRAPAAKLLLRLYGPFLPASHIVNYLDNIDQTVREEACLAISENCSKDHLGEVASALLAVEPWRMESMIMTVKKDMELSNNPEVRESMALILASLGLEAKEGTSIKEKIEVLLKHRWRVCEQKRRGLRGVEQCWRS